MFKSLLEDMPITVRLNKQTGETCWFNPKDFCWYSNETVKVKKEAYRKIREEAR